ncbi:MAG: ATP-binding protein [Nanoarchaeota archaeon]
MKCAVIGTHSTGKSTLIQDVASRLTGHNIGIVPEVVREIGVPVNKRSNLEAQSRILDAQIAFEEAQDADIVLCDRSVLDNYCYLYNIYGGDHPEHFSRVCNHLSTYDVLFLTTVDPQKMPQSDGFRDTDRDFQMRIQTILHRKLEDLEVFLTEQGLQVIPVSSAEQMHDHIRGMLE